MTKSRIFFLLSLSFIGGVAAASFYWPRIIDKSLIFIILAIAIGLLAVFYADKRIILSAFILTAFIFGIYLTSLKLSAIKNLPGNEKNFFGEAVVIKEPEIKNNYQKITVWGQGVRMLITAAKYPQYFYGDRLEVSCQLKIPENKDSSFDYQMYLAKDGIFYECKNAKIENPPARGRENKGNLFYVGIIKIKNRCNVMISKLIPAPEAGLMSGLILGGDDLLSKDYQDDFSRTGLTHIVAVSGYNVTILAEYLMLLGIFIGLWRPQAFWFAAFGIIFFVIMTGLPSSAVRAGVMGILLIWAMKHGRLANSQNAILFAAEVMLLINPLLLRWDIGFQLSFLATLGIIYLSPFFERGFIKKHRAFGLMEILMLTISAQIFVLPVILYNFNRLSLISPLANIMILPVIPLTMLLGFLAVLISFIFYPLGQMAAWLSYLPLKYETTVIHYLSGLKYASVETTLAWWGVALWYIILAVAVYFLKNVQKNNL